MLRGFYASASGMVAQLARQDTYAANLANASTTGYRRLQTALGQFRQNLAAALQDSDGASGGTEVRPAGVDSSPGPLTTTASPTDLALSGNGFFTVQTARGLAYTRDGRFHLDDQQRLVTARGDLVLGQRGPITLPKAEFTVTASGQVTCAGQTVDTLRLAEPVKPQPLGEGLYRAVTPRPASGVTVTQGALEGSNVNTVQEMGRMLNGFRYYEANATALRYQDESLSALYKVVE